MTIAEIYKELDSKLVEMLDKLQRFYSKCNGASTITRIQGFYTYLASFNPQMPGVPQPQLSDTRVAALRLEVQALLEEGERELEYYRKFGVVTRGAYQNDLWPAPATIVVRFGGVPVDQ